MANPKPRRECHCNVCHGKLVSTSTWYNHNPGGRRRRYLQLPQETMDAIPRQPETGFFPWARKRRFNEDDDNDGPTDTSEQVAGSSSDFAPSKGSHKVTTKKAPKPEKVPAPKRLRREERKKENQEISDEDFEKHRRNISRSAKAEPDSGKGASP